MKSPSISLRETQPLKPSLRGLQALRAAYSDVVYRSRWYVIALWSIGLLVSVPFAHVLPTLLHNSGYTISNSESQQVTTTMTTTLHQPALTASCPFSCSVPYSGCRWITRYSCSCAFAKSGKQHM